jgi:hypothetical protein
MLKPRYPSRDHEPPEGSEPASPIVMPGHAEPTIYDVARVAGVAPSTVSRALSKPGRLSFKTAERLGQGAEQLGYRTGRMERVVSERGTGMLGMLVADIANPAVHHRRRCRTLPHSCQHVRARAAHSRH